LKREELTRGSGEGRFGLGRTGMKERRCTKNSVVVQSEKKEFPCVPRVSVVEKAGKIGGMRRGKKESKGLKEAGVLSKGGS